MDRNNVLNFTRLNEGAGFRGAISEQDLSGVGLHIFRNNGIGLIVALLVSLGLWAVIWRAVASFVFWVGG
jgi:hypothetical protein